MIVSSSSSSLPSLRTFLFLLSLSLSLLRTVVNGTPILPVFAWNSWFAYDLSVNETHVRSNAEAIVRLGLPQLLRNNNSYFYVNLDAGWETIRNSTTGELQYNTTKFPSGLGALGTYIQSLGLRFGAYGSRGPSGCDGKAGTVAPYIQQDMNFYASWNANYLKIDSCSATMSHGQAIAEYTAFQNALNVTDVPFILSLCGWLKWYGLASLANNGQGVGQSARIGPDALYWSSILMNIDAAADLASVVSGIPGHFIDVDEVMGPSRNRPINYNQTLTQVAIIGIVASPLLLSFDLTNISPTDPDITMFTNPEFLAIHQDESETGPVFARLVGGYVSQDKLPVLTRLPCDSANPVVQWKFTPTVNSTTGIYESVNVPNWCISAGPAWPDTTSNAQVIWIQECNTTATCADAKCSNQQFTIDPVSHLMTSLDWPINNNPAAGPYVTLDTVPNGLFLEERLVGPAGSLFNDSTAQLWSYDSTTGLLSSVGNGTCLGAEPRDTLNIWYRKLIDGSIALLLINFGPDTQTVTCDTACFNAAGFTDRSTTFSIRDIWARTTIGTTTVQQGYGKELLPNGNSQFVRLTPQ